MAVLIAIKLVHTAIWALLATCIVAIPIVGLRRRFTGALTLTAFVLIECGILALNHGRCPLTDVAARYTAERGANFDIYLPNWLAQRNKAIFGALSCCLGMATMWIFYQTEYSPFQRNNGRELNNFLTRYLAQLYGNFRSVEANARGAIVGEKDVSVIKEKSVLWFITLQWIAFRFFFIESFLRTIIFQIIRNSSYYLVFVPCIFLVAILFIGHYANFSQVNILEAKSNIYQQNSFYVFFAILLSVYYRYLKNSVSFIMESIREHEWTQFHDLNMDHTLITLIETYTGEIAFWRHRLKPGVRED